MTSTPPPPPPAGPGALDGFFDSLRRMNLARRQERWIGGVAGGIGARLGIDPLIVRGVFLVITLFGGFGLLVYGLAWALLPEASDGRIHLQEAIRGRFDAALVGAIIFTVIGLSRIGFWWDGWVGIPFMIGMIALVALVVVVIAGVRSSGKSGPGASPGWGGHPPTGPTPPPTWGGHPPAGPTPPPTWGGSGQFSTTHPEQGSPAPPAAGSGSVAGAQGAPGAWADEQADAAGPWAEDTADPAAPGEPAAAPADPAHGGAAHGADAAPTTSYPTQPATSASADDSSHTWQTGQGAWTAGATPWAGHHGGAGEDQWTSGPAHWATGEQQEAAGHGGSSGAGPGGLPPTPPPTTPPPASPAKPSRPGPGRVLVRLTFGLALLAIAGLVLAGEYYGWSTSPWLVAFGGALVVIGLGATLAGLLGRRSASLGVVGTLLAIVLVPWAVTANVLADYDFTSTSSYGDRYWAPQDADQAARGYSLAAGTLEVDLSDLADDTVSTPIDIDLAAGEVVLLVPDEMPVTVTANVQGEATAVNLSDWSAEVNDERRPLGNHTDLGWRFGTTPLAVELTSPEAAEATPIQVNLDVAFGAIEVRELS